MLSPRIVVCMGVYNEAQFLRETIPSVLRQTMPYFALLIHDNGSTDASWDILSDFSNQDERITLTHSDRNLTAPEAANFGFNYAMSVWEQCQWFLGMGADDIIDRDYLETILHVADAFPGVNCIFSPARFIDHPEKGVYHYPPYNPKTTHRVLHVPGWRAITRELWDAMGGEWTGINQGSDWEWICRASVKGLLRPYQLSQSYLSLRIRTDRVAESDRADKPALFARLNALMEGRVNA